MLQDSLAQMRASLKQIGEVKITYWPADERRKRSGMSSLELTAIKAQTSFEQTDEEGLTTWAESIDFLIAPDDLVLNQVQLEPQAGDQIQELIGSNLCLFEVMALDGQTTWRWTDPYRTLRRVHTKQVEEK